MANPAQATSLPQRLVNFFARYPPQLHSAAVRRPAPRPKEATVPQTPLPSPYTSDRDAKGAQALKPTEWTPASALLVTSDTVRNPFLPHKRFGKWESPRYGLRQQADLMKLAIKYKVETLLPPSRKSPEFKDKRRQERGLQVKGTGIGQKVKGHKWERTMESRLEDRRKAMEGMPEMVRMWKQVMDVDGSNGPSGNGNAPTELVEASFYSLFWRVCSFWLSNAILAPVRIASRIDTTTCTSHIRSLGWSSYFFLFLSKYTTNILCTIQTAVTYPNASQWILTHHIQPLLLRSPVKKGPSFGVSDC
ncbi:unnamed protein product [Penicillium salamii]|nr:unnamed protein product [Penicillium salamii]CAG8402968.1 unnamed protein product [Penicillium salamii]